MQPVYKDSIYQKHASRDKSIRDHMAKVDKNYAVDINQALYADLEAAEKLKFFTVVDPDGKNFLLINFFGFKLESCKLSFQQIYYLFIREIDQLLRTKPKVRYSVVYYHILTDTRDPFEQLKAIYKKLPSFYYGLLESIYVVGPNFVLKSFNLFSFGSWIKLFNNYLIYIQEPQDLTKVKRIMDVKALNYCPREIRQKVITESVQESMIAQFTKQEAKVVPSFNKVQAFFNRQLSDHKLNNEMKLPLILSVLVETVRSKKEICCLEGIFRRAGSIDDDEQIIEILQKMTTFKTLELQNYGYSIGSLIKKFFAELSTPVIPYEIYDELLGTKIDQEHALEISNSFLKKLPELNKRCVIYVLLLLSEQILPRWEENKMNHHNLAVVFYPCFFRSRQASLNDLINSGKFAALLKFMLEHIEELEIHTQYNMIRKGQKKALSNLKSQGIEKKEETV